MSIPEILSTPFLSSILVRSLVVGLLTALCAALLGVTLVLKRYSMIGDGLSHVSFGALAIAVTIGLRKILTKKQLWVAGALGAVAHSIGQMAMAVLLTSTPGLLAYLPVMMAVSIVTGTFTGLCAQFLVNRGNLWKTISK